MPRELTKSDLHTLHWLTLREVAGELGVSDEAVRQLCIAGTLRSVPVTGTTRKHRRVKREWLDDYLKKQEKNDVRNRASLNAPLARRSSSERNLLGI